jgi:hypothetical protein
VNSPTIVLDATRTQGDALVDAQTQKRFGIAIEAEQYELAADDGKLSVPIRRQIG